MKYFWEFISNISIALLIFGIGYFLLPMIDYQFKLFILIDELTDGGGDVIAIACGVLGAVGVFYPRSKKEQEQSDNTSSRSSAE